MSQLDKIQRPFGHSSEYMILEGKRMSKRHGCLQAYIFYIVLFVVYFIIMGKIIALFLPSLQSDTTLEIVLGSSALLSIITVLIIKNRNSIRKLLHL